MINLIFLSFCFLSINVFAESVLNTEAVALFLHRNSKSGGEDFNPANVNSRPNGINLQELELRFHSDVDFTTKLNVIFSMAPEYESDGTSINEKWNWEPEILNAESTALSGYVFKLGKFKADLGDHNLLHTHEFPFVEAPLANVHLLGEAGLNDVGVSAAYKFPTQWTNEITLQYFRGQGENEAFKSPSPGGGVGLLNWNNFFETTESLSLEFGLSYARGGNSFRKTTTLEVVDFTLGWYPSKETDIGSVEWTTEFLSRTRSQQDVTDEKGSGVSSYLMYQLSKAWKLSYRFDNLTVNESFDPTTLPNTTVDRHSLGFTLNSGGHSSYKFEVNQNKGFNNEKENTFFIQANFLISSHHNHKH